MWLKSFNWMVCCTIDRKERILKWWSTYNFFLIKDIDKFFPDLKLFVCVFRVNQSWIYRLFYIDCWFYEVFHYFSIGFCLYYLKFCYKRDFMMFTWLWVVGNNVHSQKINVKIFNQLLCHFVALLFSQLVTVWQRWYLWW